MFRDILGRRFEQMKPPGGRFQSDFPGRDYTEKPLVFQVFTQTPDRHRDLFRVPIEPEERTGVEQQPQSSSPLKARRISSGRGSKNSGGIMVFSSAPNTGFRLRCFGSERISAMG